MDLLPNKSRDSYGQDGQEDGKDEVRSTLIGRNITVYGKRTSVRLEPEMWEALQYVSRKERCTIHNICTLVYLRKQNNTSLTAAIRVFLMLYFRAAATEDGHQKAGHGSFERMKRRARIPAHMDAHFGSRGRGSDKSMPDKKKSRVA